MFLLWNLLRSCSLPLNFCVWEITSAANLSLLQRQELTTHTQIQQTHTHETQFPFPPTTTTTSSNITTQQSQKEEDKGQRDNSIRLSTIQSLHSIDSLKGTIEYTRDWHLIPGRWTISFRRETWIKVHVRQS